MIYGDDEKKEEQKGDNKTAEEKKRIGEEAGEGTTEGSEE